jgi:hypothetical protein
MTRLGFCLAAVLLLAGALALPAADFTQEAAGAAPAEAPEAVRALLVAEGIRVKSGAKVIAEYWPRKAAFEGTPASGFGTRFQTIPEGALIGVVRFDEQWRDFRRQNVAAGLYTMRYVLHPEDGNHLGVAPSRDFAALVKIGDDTEPAKNYPFKEAVELTKKVGNPHPTVMRLEMGGDKTPNLWKDDDGNEVLDLDVAGEPVGFVVEGEAGE